MSKLITTLIILLFSINYNIFGSDLKALLSEFTDQQRIALYNGEELINLGKSPDDVTLLPAFAYSSTIQNNIEAMNPNIFVEVLLLAPVPEEFKRDSFSSQKERMRAIYNIFRKVSTLKGLEYYSHSRKRMRILFKEYFAINNLHDKKRVDDPVVSHVPAESEIHVQQTDSTFGKSYYEITYKSRENQILVTMQNASRLSYNFIPVVDKGGMQIMLGVIVLDDTILFYGTSSARVFGIFGLDKKIRHSFYNRIKAFHSWFTEHLSHYSENTN